MGFDFGLFYKIPVAAPWHARSEYEAYHDVVKQAVRGDEVGFSHLIELFGEHVIPAFRPSP